MVIGLAQAEVGAESSHADALEELPACLPLVGKTIDEELSAVVRIGRKRFQGLEVGHGILVLALMVIGPGAGGRPIDRLEMRGADAVDTGFERRQLGRGGTVGGAEERDSLDVVVGGTGGTLIREVDRLGVEGGGPMAFDPAAQSRQFLAPVQRAGHEVTIAVARPADELIEVGQIMRADDPGFGGEPEQQDDRQDTNGAPTGCEDRRRGRRCGLGRGRFLVRGRARRIGRRRRRSARSTGQAAVF